MRNIVYVAPFPMETTLRFARGLADLDHVRLLGVFQEAPQAAQARGFSDVVTVSDALDPGAICRGIESLVRRYGPPHRITGILEPLQVPLAQVRQHFGVPGPSVATAERFRDKALMKETLRAHGIPCARHRLVHDAASGQDFADEVGVPVVLKPPAGAGCKATWRIDDRRGLTEALHALRPSREQPLLMEEFVRGREFSFETITLGGKVHASSLSHYIPGPLEVMQTPWMQWVCLLPRSIDGSEYHDIRQVGARVVQSLGLEDGMTHMEWFRRDDGTLAVGEIAARPPGGQLTRMTGLVHDIDIYRAWARAVVDGAFDGPWRRRWAAGTAFLRGMGRGRVTRVEGVEEAQRRIGHLVAEAKLPQVGAPKADTYEGDGYVIVRHEDTEVVREALQILVQTVRIHYA